MTNPKIIFTEAPQGQNIRKIEIDYEELIEMIKNENLDIIYSSHFSHGNSYSKATLYLIKSGYIFAGKGDLEVLNEYFAIKDKGFNEFADFLEAERCGINKAEEFYEFKNSDFKGPSKKHYRTYLEAKSKGFERKGRYESAMQLGVSSREEFDKYLESNIRPYEDYLKAKKGGFRSKILYEKAKTLNIENRNELFRYYVDKYKPIEDQIKEIINDSNKAFVSDSYEEFIRLEYLAVEKLADLTLLKIKLEVDLPRDDDRKINDIINLIQAETNEKFIDIDELDKWRKLRNKVIHENLKLDKQIAENAKSFLQPILNKMMKISEEALNNLN